MNDEAHSRMIACRPYNPDPYQADARPSELLYIWLNACLEEFGLSSKNIFSSITDSDSNVKRACAVILSKRWEWCILHALNRFVAELLGNSSATSESSKQVQTLFNEIRDVFRQCRSSPKLQKVFVWPS